jgi:hypothetical protein
LLSDLNKLQVLENEVEKSAEATRLLVEMMAAPC